MIFEVLGYLLASLLGYNLFVYLQHISKLKDYPPGPFPWPIIGNLHLMLRDKPYDTVFTKLARKYGNVFSLSFGMKRTVVVQTIEPAREALITSGTDFAGRDTAHPIVGLATRNWKGIVFADYGVNWKRARKLGHLGIRAFGDGMGKLDVIITEESDALHKRFNLSMENPLDFKKDIELAVVNILCKILFGRRYNIQDPEFETIVKFALQLQLEALSDDPVAIFSWLRYLPNKSFTNTQKCLQIRDPFLKKMLVDHKRQLHQEREPKSFIDSLIQLQKDDKMGNRSKAIDEMDDDQIEMIIKDLIMAGSETINLTLRWIILYLIHFPECQGKVHEEMTRNLGKGNKPDLNDRPNLPYIQAFIHEALRYSSLVPLGIPHKAIKNSSINRKKIPKGTDVLFNLWNMHFDERHWKKPREFNPCRWLDDDGKFVPAGKNLSFLAFSAGRRVCIGESLAKAEFFILISRLIFEYELQADPSKPMPSIYTSKGVISLAPDHFKVVFKKRY